MPQEEHAGIRFGLYSCVRSQPGDSKVPLLGCRLMSAQICHADCHPLLMGVIHAPFLVGFQKFSPEVPVPEAGTLQLVVCHVGPESRKCICKPKPKRPGHIATDEAKRCVPNHF